MSLSTRKRINCNLLLYIFTILFRKGSGGFKVGGIPPPQRNSRTGNAHYQVTNSPRVDPHQQHVQVLFLRLIKNQYCSKYHNKFFLESRVLTLIF